MACHSFWSIPEACPARHSAISRRNAPITYTLTAAITGTTVVQVDAIHLGRSSLPAGQRVWPELGPPTDQVGEPFVLVSGLPDGFGKGAQNLSPTVSGRPDLAVDRIDHQGKQLVYGGDVAVHPHR